MDAIAVDIKEGDNDVITLADAADREVIERELDVNVVVVASAGTGKTEALIRRMVASVVSGVVDIDALVAITFTRMAAGEMRARFAEKLREAAAESDRARQALRRIDRCFIGTIHAFCARLLRERPLEAGMRPDFTEVDEHEVTVLWRHFWQDALQQLYAQGDARIDDLKRFGINVGDLYEFFVNRSENSDLVLKPGVDTEPDLTEPLSEVTAQVEAIKSRLGKIPDQRDGLLDQIDRADHYRLNRGIHDAADRAELLKIYRRGFKDVTLKAWPDQALASDVKKNIVPDLLSQVVDPALTEWRQYVYGRIVPLMEEIVERFADHRRDRGLVTFHDLLVYTARLLKRRPDVRRFFQSKFSAFFVDEFQDTDPLQAEIIMFLSSADSAVSDWRDAVPEPGRLFVVGDEKQSIYRFRRADIDVFRRVRSNILESGGKLVRLQTSFRSQPPLCEWLNGAFARLFAEHDRSHQAEYDDLIPHRELASGPVCVQRITIGRVPGNVETDIAVLEAARIAAYIVSQTTGEQATRAPGDFMILTRRRKYLNVYASALEKNDVPYDIVGGDSLATSEELASLVQMLEVVRRPRDEVAMLGFLRGPLVGLGDDELYEFRKAGGRFRVSHLVREGVSEELSARLSEVRDVLDRARDDVMLMSPAAALESILDWTGLMAFSAGMERGATRAGNLMRALSLVRSWEETGMNWSEILAELHAVISDRKYVYEQMTLDVGRSDVVRVMNVHQAKGLQAPVVILADSYQRNEPKPSQHVSRADRTEYLSIPITASRNGVFSETVAEPVGWESDLEEEKLYATAEELRTVYVAATRARDLLVVSMYAQKRKGPWCRLYPMLASMPEIEVAKAAAAAPEKDRLQDIGVLLKRVQDYWLQAAEPSVRVSTATGKDPAREVEDVPGSGRGTDYGSVMHEMIQTLLENRVQDVASLARIRAEAAGITRHADDLVRELELLADSDLWRELDASADAFSEVPFGYRLPDEDTIVRGTMDLVYLTDAGWKIVDFKTHRTDTPESIDDLQIRYAPQLRTYRNAWKEITGEEVVETGLWLTNKGLYVPLADHVGID